MGTSILPLWGTLRALKASPCLLVGCTLMSNQVLKLAACSLQNDPKVGCTVLSGMMLLVTQLRNLRCVAPVACLGLMAIGIMIYMRVRVRPMFKFPEGQMKTGNFLFGENFDPELRKVHGLSTDEELAQ